MPNMPADLAHRDLDADAGQEPDEDAARQEVGDEPEPRTRARIRSTAHISAVSDAISMYCRAIRRRGP